MTSKKWKSNNRMNKILHKLLHTFLLNSFFKCKKTTIVVMVEVGINTALPISKTSEDDLKEYFFLSFKFL